MANRRIATTQRSGLSVAQVGGSDIYKSRNQIQFVVQQGQLGDAYVALFSEPVENDRTIDWYTDADGEPVRAVDLPPEERNQVLKQFREMLEKLQGFANTLRNNNSQTYRNYADIVEKALSLPGIESLYAVDGRPVLVNWGFSLGDNSLVEDTKRLMKEIEDKLKENAGDGISRELDSASRESDTKAAPDGDDKPDAEAQQQAEPEAEPESSPEPSPAAPDASSAASRPQEPPVAPVITAPPAPAKSSSWFPALMAGAALILAGAAAAWYFLMHKPETPAHTPEPSLAWLKGTFTAKDVLINENNEAVNLTLAFEGEDGKGKTYISEARQTCEGSVVAAPLDETKVSFAVGKLTCPNGNDYEPFTMICQKGQSLCTGTLENGDTWQLEVNIQGAAR